MEYFVNSPSNISGFDLNEVMKKKHVLSVFVSVRVCDIGEDIVTILPFCKPGLKQYFNTCIW